MSARGGAFDRIVAEVETWVESVAPDAEVETWVESVAPDAEG